MGGSSLCLLPDELHGLEVVRLLLPVARLLVSHVVAEDVPVPVLPERGLPGDPERVLVHGGDADVHGRPGGGLLSRLKGHGVGGARHADLVLGDDPARRKCCVQNGVCRSLKLATFLQQKKNSPSKLLQR